MCCSQVFILTSRSASWRGGGPIVSCFTQKDGGHSEVQGLAQGLSRQDLCIWGAKESGYPHLFHSAGDGVPPAQWRNSDSRPGPQHREDRTIPGSHVSRLLPSAVCCCRPPLSLLNYVSGQENCDRMGNEHPSQARMWKCISYLLLCNKLTHNLVI